MSTAAPQAPPASPAPPEEEFWKHYSPHGEAPLSLAGSAALHILAVGLLFGFAILIASLFVTKRELPVEPVRLIDAPGGGGDVTLPKKGGGPGVGTDAQPVENTGQSDPANVPNPALAEEAPKLKPLEKVQPEDLSKSFRQEDARVIADSNSPSTQAFAKLEESLREKLRPRDNPSTGGGGSGGVGKDGGRGAGTDKGKDSGKGIGSKATLSQREKRMLRWHMRFTANTGLEYVNQLKSLGAILAVPVGGDYQIVKNENLGPNARLESTDLSKIERIYWIDDKPRSVGDVMAALNLDVKPNRFVAFMPPQLEDQLYEMEKDYVERTLRRKFQEERIEETNFRVVHKGGGYKVELVNVAMRGGR